MKISSGSKAIDDLLDGGFDTGVITTIFGPGACGKTTLGIQATTSVGKSVYIDSEGGFSAERYLQISDEDHLGKVILLKPLNFAEQHKTIMNFSENFSKKIKLLVLDTLSMHYRVEISKKNQNANNMMTIQLSLLNRIARENSIPVLIMNQVYSSMRSGVRPVGGRFTEIASKCMIELTEDKRAIIRMHRSLPQGKEIRYKIENAGIVPA